MLTNIFRLTMVLASLLVSLLSAAQPQEAIDWINANAIAIPDADPAGSIGDFASKAPKEFNDATLFGFGEATHHGKEFFDLKSKFFRYLVINNGVRVFMMEESYQAEAGINEWISGGKGDVSSILDNFQIAPWHCQEVVSLLQWMRDFNTGRPSEDQIRFYGIDSQFGKGIDDQVIRFASKKNIVIEESLLVALKESSAKQMIGKDEKWAAAHLLKIQRLKKDFIGYRDIAIPEEASEYNKMIRYLSVLENYGTYVGEGSCGARDEQMFNNVKYVLDNFEPDSKCFIWAHNEHVNKQGHSGSIINLGKLLKNQYQEKYYCVGFDFGTGNLWGLLKKNGRFQGQFSRLDKPYKKTFAATLFAARPDVYFLNIQNVEPTDVNFFKEKKKQLAIGGPGYNPKKPVFMYRNYYDAFDGLIFIKNINPPTYTRL